MSKDIQPKLTEQVALIEGLTRKPTGCVVLLHSGGADSTATGIKLTEQGYSVHSLFIDYGQTAREAEELLALKSSEHLGFMHPEIIPMADLMITLSTSSLLGGEAKDDTSAWVPARNTMFMIVAGSYACKIDADGIAIGFMAEDQGVFGDSNLVHHQIVQSLLTQSLSRPMEVFTPLKSMTKLDVLRYLVEHDVLQYTVSCWNAKVLNETVVSCNECANCIERNKNLHLLLEELKLELGEEEFSLVIRALEKVNFAHSGIKGGVSALVRGVLKK